MTETITKIIERNIFGPPRIQIEPDADLREIGCDELAIHGIALDLGDELERDIDDEEAEKWSTVGDIIASAKGKIDV